MAPYVQCINTRVRRTFHLVFSVTLILPHNIIRALRCVETVQLDIPEMGGRARAALMVKWDCVLLVSATRWHVVRSLVILPIVNARQLIPETE